MAEQLQRWIGRTASEAGWLNCYRVWVAEQLVFERMQVVRLQLLAITFLHRSSDNILAGFSMTGGMLRQMISLIVRCEGIRIPVLITLVINVGCH